MSKNDDLINAVVSASVEQEGKAKLSCADAFKLAARFNVELLEIGKVCNRQAIKICKCQLGCFK